MKLYRQIAVPDEEGDYKIAHRLDRNPKPATMSLEYDVFVLSLEDMQALWNAAQSNAMDEAKRWDSGGVHVVTPPDFTPYLQSKGITL